MSCFTEKHNIDERPIKRCDDTTVILPYNEEFGVIWLGLILPSCVLKQHGLLFYSLFLEKCIFLFWSQWFVLIFEVEQQKLWFVCIQIIFEILSWIVNIILLFAFLQKITWLQSEKIKISISRFFFCTTSVVVNQCRKCNLENNIFKFEISCFIKVFALDIKFTLSSNK